MHAVRATGRPQRLKHPLYVLYGSNTSTSQTFAPIASAVSAHGFQVTLGMLDSIVERVPNEAPLTIVTMSFEGMCLARAVFSAHLASRRAGG